MYLGEVLQTSPHLQLVLLLLKAVQTTALWLTTNGHLPLHLKYIYGKLCAALETLLHSWC